MLWAPSRQGLRRHLRKQLRGIGRLCKYIYVYTYIHIIYIYVFWFHKGSIPSRCYHVCLCLDGARILSQSCINSLNFKLEIPSRRSPRRNLNGIDPLVSGPLRHYETSKEEQLRNETAKEEQLRNETAKEEQLRNETAKEVSLSYECLQHNSNKIVKT